jgi:hypothetical protein
MANVPTLSRTIPVLEFLQQTWENMADEGKFHEVSDAIRAATANLNKWYRKVDDTDAYFIALGSYLFICITLSHPALALDPNYKLAYAEAKWDPEFFRQGVERLEQVVRMHASFFIRTSE